MKYICPHLLSLLLIATPGLAESTDSSHLAYGEVALDKGTINSIRTAATAAYVDASPRGLTNMDSASVKICFTLFNDEAGLGKKGDRIAPVIIYALGAARGFVLVNVENMKTQVVFPNNEKHTEQGVAPYVAQSAPSGER